MPKEVTYGVARNTHPAGIGAQDRFDPVEAVTDDIQTLLDDMLETMYDAPGIGLAAVQIGITKRIVVIDAVRDEDAHAIRYF